MAARCITVAWACAACLLAVTGLPGPAAAAPAAATEARIAADAPDAPVASLVGAAMLQARRMLHALVQGDTPAFDAAHHELLRLEAALRESPEVDRTQLAELDQALAMAALSRSLETATELQRAARAVIAAGARASADPGP